MAISEKEELELLRLRKKKAQAKTAAQEPAKQYPGSYGFTAPSPKKGEYVSASDDPANVGFTNALDSIDKATYQAGAAVTDLASKAGLPPGAAGLAGYAANVGIQSAPMAIGGATRALAGPIRNQAKDLMQSAIKPILKQLKSGDAATAIDTMLKEGINPTKGGVEKLREKIAELNDKITPLIANSSETVNKSEVGRRLLDTYDKFLKQVNPEADLNAIKKAWFEFRNHPLLKGKTEIPVQLAQELKQGTYKQVAKKYGEMSSADIEAQKGLAFGLKEGIAEKIPEIASLNAAESTLITTLNVAERRALMDLNKNPAGLALLSHNKAAFAAFIADKSPLFKSLVARMLYSGAEGVLPAVTETGIGATQVLRAPNVNDKKP